MRVLAGTGIRNAELRSLYVGSFDRDRVPARVRVIGKGEKDRVIPVPATAMVSVDTYLAERGHQLPSAVLFVRRDERPLDGSFLDRRITRIFEEAAVSLHAGEKAHRFRHHYAKTLLENGMNLEEIRSLLGHEDVSTTGIYTKMAAADVLDAAKLAPGANLR